MTDNRYAAKMLLPDGQLRTIAAGLAYVVSALYLFHPHLGVPGLLVYLNVGTPFIDPRPVLFVGSGVALVGGVKLALFGVRRRPIYVLGILLLVGHLFGYGWWHLGGHGSALPGIAGYGHGHTLSSLVVHLAEDRWALMTKLFELLLVGVLAVLFFRERHGWTNDVADER